MKNISINRLLNLASVTSRKSVFLLGPRQVGKSTYLATQYPVRPDLFVSLLDQSTYLEWAARPSRLRESIAAIHAVTKTIVIDEIQRLPELLNEVHALIEEHDYRFVLTGSSARKLRKQGVNLLGGRAAWRELHPLTYWELGDKFDLDRAFNNGLLPSLYFSEAPEEDANDYVGLYLKEEIAAEGITRNLPTFVNFLNVAALCHSQQINFANIASDVGVSRVTIQSYFQVLVDTLIGCYLEPYRASQKRKSVATPKFYLFDSSVVRALRRLGRILPASKDYGDFFEHFIFHHLRSYIAYKDHTGTLNFWRSSSKHEVDFILNEEIAIECKATRSPTPADFKGLKAFREEGRARAYILVCNVERPFESDGFLVLPWKEFLDRLWAQAF